MFSKDEAHTDEPADKGAPYNEPSIEAAPLEDTTKSRWERSWPTIACGAGLFSDGYLNGVRFPVFLCFQALASSVLAF